MTHSGRARGHDLATLADTLGFEPFVKAVYDHLTDVHSATPLALSVEGDWGSGKSSFMLQLRRMIEASSRGDYVVWFNAWRHDKEESVWAAFAVDFVRQLNRGIWRKCDWRNWPKLRNLCAWFPSLRYVKQIESFKITKWLRNRLPVQLFGWAVCPLSPISIALWAIWKLEIAVKLSLTRFDWDRGWLDVLKTVSLLAFWVALGIYAVLAWEPGMWKSLNDNLPTAVSSGAIVPGLAAIVGALGAAFTVAYKFTGNPLRYNLRKYARGPNYDDKIAFSEKFHSDFTKLVLAMSGGKRIYIFIDDLDRCDVPKAADLMQALNVMIPDSSDRDALPLVYILGLDREKVAAGLAVKFKDLLPYLGSIETDETQSARHARDNGLLFGYSFIEKFIQLPFLVPRPKKTNLAEFLDGLFPRAEFVEPQIASGETVPVVQQPSDARSDPAGGKTGAAPDETAGGDPRQGSGNAGGSAPETPLSPLSEPRHPFESPEDWASFFREPSCRLRELIEMVAPAFGYNPRTLKHFINLFRLRARIWHQVSEQAIAGKYVPEICMEQLAKFVAISLRWPLLLNEMQLDDALLSAIVACAKALHDKEWKNGGAEPEGGERYPPDTQRAAERWCRTAELVRLILHGIPDPSRRDRYDLQRLPIAELLSTLPPLAAPIAQVAQKDQDARVRQLDTKTSVPEDILRAIAAAEKGDRIADSISEDYWVTIPAGAFQMGAQKKDRAAPNYDALAYRDESLVHEVHLEAYRIGKYPVTVREFERFVGADGYANEAHWKAGGFGKHEQPESWDEQLAHLNRPVTPVSWHEAMAYAHWAECWLPTEAEWERAARGTQGRRYPWGDDKPSESLANYNSNIENPTPVGAYSQGGTPEGIQDMAGNVSEWCRDSWHESYSDAPTDGTAWTTGEEQSARVLRGGSWSSSVRTIRSAYRNRARPDLRDDFIGFRVSAGT